MSRRVLICVAIRMEAVAVARALNLTFDSDRLGATGFMKPDTQIDLHVIGIGGSHLPKELDATDLALVISAGLAGALDPALKHGDVVVDQIHTSHSVVTTLEEKAALFAQTGARAVDMETDKIRALSARAGVRCVAIRAISDTAHEAIDPAVLGMVDQTGRMRIGAVVSRLLSRPLLIPRLLRLRANSNRALDQLGRVLAGYLERSV